MSFEWPNNDQWCWADIPVKAKYYNPILGADLWTDGQRPPTHYVACDEPISHPIGLCQTHAEAILPTYEGADN